MKLFLQSRSEDTYLEEPHLWPLTIQNNYVGQTTTCWSLSDKKLLIQPSKLPYNPYALSLANKRLWGTLSKAFCKSKYVNKINFVTTINNSSPVFHYR